MIAPDGTRFPWVLARNRVWHRRIPSEGWYDRVVGDSCATLCGRSVRPLCISGDRPTPRAGGVCPDCTPEDTA